MSESELRRRWFEDIPVGEFHVLGRHTFIEPEMIAFARQFAPRPEYTAPEAAKKLRWQGLVAAPFHVTSMWMRNMVDYMEAYNLGVHDGRHHGAGIGVSNLEWLQPVRPGDTLTYTHEVVRKPDKVLRNKWGIITSRNEAYNQHQQRVMSFEVDILAERNPASR